MFFLTSVCHQTLHSFSIIPIIRIFSSWTNRHVMNVHARCIHAMHAMTMLCFPVDTSNSQVMSKTCVKNLDMWTSYIVLNTVFSIFLATWQLAIFVYNANCMLLTLIFYYMTIWESTRAIFSIFTASERCLYIWVSNPIRQHIGKGNLSNCVTYTPSSWHSPFNRVCLVCT